MTCATRAVQDNFAFAGRQQRKLHLRFGWTGLPMDRPPVDQPLA